MNEIAEKYNAWENDIKNQYDILFKGATYTIFDGVIDPELYYKSPLKILVFNREAYDVDQVPYDLNHTIMEQISAGEYVFPYSNNLRINLFRFLKVLHLVENENFDELNKEDLPELIGEFSEQEFNDLMRSCAYINIKKSDGQPKSKRSILASDFQKGLPVIKEQLRYFNPSIILGGNIGDAFPDEGFQWSSNFLYRHENAEVLWELKIEDRMVPFIDNWHPSAVHYRGGSSKNIAIDLFELLRSQKREYWEKHIGLECFR